MDNFDAYARRYLMQWDARATVRGAPRYRPEPGTRIDFPLALLPVAAHPLVQAQGQAAVDRMLARAAYEWHGVIADSELEIIAGLCGKLASPGHDFPMPSAARQVAMTIATDETYHAFVGREFMQTIAAAAGMEDAYANDKPFPHPGLTMIQREADPRYRTECEFMALCFIETSITEELLGYSRFDANPTPFQRMAREHMVDEGRHARYFTLLLEHMWNTVSAPCREAMANLLPRFLDVTTEAGESSAYQRYMLAALDLDAADVETVLAETDRVVPATKYDRKMAANPMKVIATAGLCRDPGTLAALVASGWHPATA